MDRGLLLAVGLLLTIALVTGLVSFVKSGQARRMKERVALAGTNVGSMADSGDMPSIRLKTGETRPLTERFLRFLRFNPDIPQEQVLPWPLVIVLGAVVAVVIAFYFGKVIRQDIAMVMGLAAGLLTIRSFFAWQHNRYVDKIFKQIPDAIGLMVRAVRAGLPVGEAIRSVASELSPPLRDEFARMLGDVAIGRPVDQAFMRLHARTGLPEFSFLAVTLGLQSQTGGNLAETLENLADIVRKRVALSKRAKALAAEARMQAGILMALPFLAVLAMSQLQEFYVDNMFHTPTGQKLVLVGLGFASFGFMIIRWMIKRAGTD